MKMKKETYRERMAALENKCAELKKENQRLMNQPDIFDSRGLDEIISVYRKQGADEMSAGNGVLFRKVNDNKSSKKLLDFMEEYKKYRQLTASLYQKEIMVNESELLKKMKQE